MKLNTPVRRDRCHFQLLTAERLHWQNETEKKKTSLSGGFHASLN
jgi:hypothetical protein